MQSYTGVVGRGTRRASTLGFPTVNIQLTDTDVSGIYAAHVLIDGKEYPAAVYADQKRNVLEAYLLDFSGDMYGQTITIRLYDKVRENEMFLDDTTLKAAIAEDVRAVQKYFKDKK